MPSKAPVVRSKNRGLTPAQMTALTALTWKLGEPLCNAEGMELVHVECRSEAQGSVLRLYIDKPGGVTLDDCMFISRQIGDLLDVHTEDQNAYLLEVSSPGTDRPLGKPEDYDRFCGQQAQIRTTVPISGQQNFTGILAGIRDEIVILKMEDTPMMIPLSQIRQARLNGYQGEN